MRACLGTQCWNCYTSSHIYQRDRYWLFGLSLANHFYYPSPIMLKRSACVFSFIRITLHSPEAEGRWRGRWQRQGQGNRTRAGAAGVERSFWRFSRMQNSSLAGGMGKGGSGKGREGGVMALSQLLLLIPRVSRLLGRCLGVVSG